MAKGFNKDTGVKDFKNSKNFGIDDNLDEDDLRRNERRVREESFDDYGDYDMVDFEKKFSKSKQNRNATVGSNLFDRIDPYGDTKMKNPYNDFIEDDIGVDYEEPKDKKTNRKRVSLVESMGIPMDEEENHVHDEDGLDYEMGSDYKESTVLNTIAGLGITVIIAKVVSKILGKDLDIANMKFKDKDNNQSTSGNGDGGGTQSEGNTRTRRGPIQGILSIVGILVGVAVIISFSFYTIGVLKNQPMPEIGGFNDIMDDILDGNSTNKMRTVTGVSYNEEILPYTVKDNIIYITDTSGNNFTVAPEQFEGNLTETGYARVVIGYDVTTQELLEMRVSEYTPSKQNERTNIDNPENNNEIVEENKDGLFYKIKEWFKKNTGFGYDK